MSTAEFSKHMIARGMKEMLKTSSLDNISVGDLARYCHISRSTIYYHFKDKYDIISWIFHSEISPIVSQPRAVGSWTDNLLAMCLYMQENRDFYTKVLHDSGQNSFYECLIDFCSRLIDQMFDQACGSRILSSGQIHTVSRIYSYGIVGVITEWSRGGMSADPLPFVQTTKDLISGKIFRQMASIHPEEGQVQPASADCRLNTHQTDLKADAGASCLQVP